MSRGNLFRRLLGREASAPSKPGKAAGAPPPRPDDPRLLGYVHTGPVATLAVSPDGATLAIAGAGPVNRELRRHHQFKEHYSVVVESDVVLTRDLEALRSPVANDERLRAVGGHTGPVARVKWEGETLWSCGDDRRVRWVDLESGLTLADHQLHVDRVLGFLPLLPGTVAETERENPKAGLGASISADRTLKVWKRETGAEVFKEFIGPAIVLDAVLSPDAGPDGAPLYLATDQRSQVIVRFGGGLDAKPEPLEGLKFDEPVYRLVWSTDRKTCWAGHRLGAVSRLALDEAGGKIVEAERRQVFDGCRVPAIAEIEVGGRSWLACGSLRGEVALVELKEGGAIHRHPRPLHGRASAMVVWSGRLIAADVYGNLYDLTDWLEKSAHG